MAAQDRVLVRPQNASPSPTYLNRMQASGVEGAQDAGSRREVREGEGRSEVRMARARAREKANPLLVWGTTVTRAMMMMMMMTSRRDGGQDYYWVLGTLAGCPLEDMKTTSRRAWPGGLAAAGASVVEWRTGPFSQKPWISITCMFYIEGELDLDFLPLYQSPLQASPILTALRCSWGRIYVPTVVPHRRPYEITFDMIFFFCLLSWLGLSWWVEMGRHGEDDQVLFQYHDPHDRVYCVTTFWGPNFFFLLWSGLISFCPTGRILTFVYLSYSKLALNVPIVIDNREYRVQIWIGL